ALCDYFARGFDNGGAAVHDRLGATGPPAGEELIAVALQEPDAFERNAELFTEHLRERCSVALPVIERAGDDGDAAVGLEPNAAHLLARRCRHFEKAADPKPAQSAALAAFSPAACKAFCVGKLQRLLQHGGEITAVVSIAGRGFARQLPRLDLVAPAQLEA